MTVDVSRIGLLGSERVFVVAEFGRLIPAGWLFAICGVADRPVPGSTIALRLFALVAMAYLWARTAEIALARSDDGSDRFYRAKVKTARYFMQRVLPQSGSLFACIVAGGGSLMAFDDEDF